jgi:hypothetical protein
MAILISVFMNFSLLVSANPYFDPNQVPVDELFLSSLNFNEDELPVVNGEGTKVLRVQVDWMPDESYQLSGFAWENSGTPALTKRAANVNLLGSYFGKLIDAETGEVVYSDSVGTGAAFRKLTRAMTFRFPEIEKPYLFEMSAENPKTGLMEKVLEKRIDPSLATPIAANPTVETRLLKRATDQKNKIVVAVYADGYLANRKSAFWSHAKKVIPALEKYLPRFQNLEFVAVFAESKIKLSDEKTDGGPVKMRDSFLGLYHPYWDKFGRWYHVVYPTSEAKYRDGLGQVAYDYPLILIDDSTYWGVGNFNQLTAIPSESPYFGYLLRHELGHFLGLNEEYDEGGPTELAFAPEIDEPWSQNLTFLDSIVNLKWASFVLDTTPVPTPIDYYSKDKAIGVYAGGYASTDLRAKIPTPGDCVMNTEDGFCDVCKEAIEQKFLFDMGLIDKSTLKNLRMAHRHQH